jgi:hypothetical protein
MNLKSLSTPIVCGLMFAAVLNAAGHETGLSGKWVTEAVLKGGSEPMRVLSLSHDLVLRPCDYWARDGGGGFGGRSSGSCQEGNRTIVMEKGTSDGPALIMELKVNKSKVSGSVFENLSDGKRDISEGSITGTKIHVVVSKKVVGSIEIATHYEGELVDTNTITLRRTSAGGKPLDTNEGGEAIALTFHRAKGK